MRSGVLAAVLLVVGASAGAAQEAHGVALVRVVVVKAVASGVVPEAKAASGTTVTGSPDRQFNVSSESPVLVSTAFQGATASASTTVPEPTRAGLAGGPGQGLQVPLTALLRAAQAAQARSVTVSVVVN